MPQEPTVKMNIVMVRIDPHTGWPYQEDDYIPHEDDPRNIFAEVHMFPVREDGTPTIPDHEKRCDCWCKPKAGIKGFYLHNYEETYRILDRKAKIPQSESL